MRKIYQSVPDVPQPLANKAVDIIERHFAVNEVRRAEDLPEESKVHLLRELDKFFQHELPKMRTKEGESVCDWGSQRSGGFLNSSIRWLVRVLRRDENSRP